MTRQMIFMESNRLYKPLKRSFVIIIMSHYYVLTQNSIKYRNDLDCVFNTTLLIVIMITF